MKEQLISIKIILDKLMRHPLLQDVSLEQVIDYCVDFMRIVRVPAMFVEKVETLHIENYRAVLPCDFLNMIQVSYCGKCIRYTTDSFHLETDNQRCLDYTYKIQNHVIITNFEEGDIDISYTAIAVDEDGFPMIPDNSNFTRALEWYVKKEWFTIQFDLGKCSQQTLQNAQQQYAFAVGACNANFQSNSLDEIESASNILNSLLLRKKEHSKGFVNAGITEYLKLH